MNAKWQLVPIRMTDAMLRAARDAWLDDPMRRTTTMWEAALAAAPKPETQPTQAVPDVVAELDALRSLADRFGDGVDWIQRALQAEAEIEAMKQQKPIAWRAVGGSIWGHKTSQDDVPLFEAAGAQPAPSVSEGWRLVPEVPTAEMLETLADSVGDVITDHIEFGTAVWEDMLSAASEAKS